MLDRLTSIAKNMGDFTQVEPWKFQPLHDLLHFCAKGESKDGTKTLSIVMTRDAIVRDIRLD